MELTLPRLPRPRRRELIRLGRKTKDVQTGLRFLMIAKLSAGLSKTEVAKALDSAVSTVVTIGRWPARARNGRPRWRVAR